MKNKNTLAYFFLILATLFWSANFIVGKAASMHDIPPFSLNFYRWFLAWLILIPFTFRELITKREYILRNSSFFIILGITSITIFNSVIYYALHYTQVISGILMISTIPVMIIFISSLLNIEKTNNFQIVGVILSFIGVVFIITKADLELVKNLKFNKGDLSMVVAMFAWAIYSVLLKKKKYELSPISLLQTIITFGFIFLIPFYLIEINMGHLIKFSKPFYLILSYVVIFPALLSFFFWIKGIGLIGANRAGIFLHLMPIFGAIMAMIIFNEKFMFYHLLGTIFILSGIILSNKKSST